MWKFTVSEKTCFKPMPLSSGNEMCFLGIPLYQNRTLNHWLIHVITYIQNSGYTTHNTSTIKNKNQIYAFPCSLTFLLSSISLAFCFIMHFTAFPVPPSSPSVTWKYWEREREREGDNNSEGRQECKNRDSGYLFNLNTNRLCIYIKNIIKW